MNILFRVIRKADIVCRRIVYNIFSNNISVGKRLNFRRRFEINAVDGGTVKIGNKVFFNNDCSINAHKSIEIGDNCIFGENVKIYDHNHIFKDLSKPIYKQGFKCKNVIIGNDCWIGSNTVILAGSIIGDHCIVGAGCIISGIIPSNSIVRSGRDIHVENIYNNKN